MYSESIFGILDGPIRIVFGFIPDDNRLKFRLINKCCQKLYDSHRSETTQYNYDLFYKKLGHNNLKYPKIFNFNTIILAYKKQHHDTIDQICKYLIDCNSMVKYIKTDAKIEILHMINKYIPKHIIWHIKNKLD